MHLVRFADAPTYIARGHDGVTPRRVQGREAGGPHGVYVSISEYPPGAGGQSVTASTEVVYLVMDGSIRVRHDFGEELLETGDSIYFEPSESRSAYNDGTELARLIVIHQPEDDES